MLLLNAVFVIGGCQLSVAQTALSCFVLTATKELHICPPLHPSENMNCSKKLFHFELMCQRKECQANVTADEADVEITLSIPTNLGSFSQVPVFHGIAFTKSPRPPYSTLVGHLAATVNSTYWMKSEGRQGYPGQSGTEGRYPGQGGNLGQRYPGQKHQLGNF